MKILDSQWEQHFIQESQLLEDKLARGELTPLASRLKIALENNILEWSNYSVWAQQNYLLPVLKRGLYKDQIIAMQKKINSIKAEYSAYELHQNQLVVFDKWEGKAIILGLEPHNLMNTFKFDYILVLAPPEIITALMNEPTQQTPIFGLTNVVTPMPAPPGSVVEVKPTVEENILDLSSDIEDDDSSSEDSHGEDDGDEKATHLELPVFDDQEHTVNFNELLSAVASTTGKTETQTQQPKPKAANSTAPALTTPPVVKTTVAPAAVKPADDEENPPSDFVASLDTTQYWNKINQDHSTMSSNVRKYFDGYVVVNLNQRKTELFKMDEELQSEKLDPAIFSFNIEDTFFANILKTRTADSISLKMLQISVLDFNYVCAMPLFLGEKPVGFILGFKISAMNQQDETALFNLMRTA